MLQEGTNPIILRYKLIYLYYIYNYHKLNSIKYTVILMPLRFFLFHSRNHRAVFREIINLISFQSIKQVYNLLLIPCCLYHEWIIEYLGYPISKSIPDDDPFHQLSNLFYSFFIKQTKFQ